MTRVVIIAQKGPTTLVDLLPAILSKTRIRVVDVAFLTWRPGRRKRLGNGVGDRIRIYGIRVWTIRHLLGLAHRARHPLRAYRLRRMLERHDIPHSEVEDVNDSAFLDRLRRLSPDLVLSVFPLQRFGPGLLSIPRMGCINVHSAPLPEYRGLHSTFWSLYNGERESGISIHFMNDDWDAGPIIMDRRFPISPGDTVYSLDRRKMAIVPGLLSDALDALIEGRVVTRENDPGKGAYYSVPSRETLLAFRKERGGRWF